ncbi:uncharacterized protein I206_104940 [Kwoniella pini CBS 10737]|uniref:Uncharacterized protein n=1 Tax=Kwoniella pini CBS 10737 TaxID=1296096 RepID=A0A1B9I860_9TREE|nr:uncharacterized protein I206_02478 [Kwoniella pini CBS 10737]OCF51762.1 hypothetical protein I206_02478 [Kwoniella pini CBS 10737]
MPNNLKVDDFRSEQISYPPFLVVPPELHVKSYKDWTHYGLWITPRSQSDRSDRTSANLTPHDLQGNALVTVGHPFAGVDITFDDGQEIRRAKNRAAEHQKKDAAGRQTERLRQEDCWKIGNDPTWQEPEGTSRADYDQSIPPFQRLLSAVSDFEFSRQAGLLPTRDRRLFGLLRDQLGLRRRYPGRHWPGSGEHGLPYIGLASSANDKAEAVKSSFEAEGSISPDDHESDPVEEVCVLLSKTELSVRGLLALARKETESGWNFEPAHRFTVIAAAFLSYLVHYNVLSEPQLNACLQRATCIARSAPQALLDAKALEDWIGLAIGWNRASWTLFGGTWGGAERGGLEKEAVLWGEQNQYNCTANETESGDDGGWLVEPIVDPRPQPLTQAQARPHLPHTLQPLVMEDVSLVGYLPFSRRRIVSILSPPNTTSDSPSYTRACHRIVTVPAPWTMAERWRNQRPTSNGEVSGIGIEDDFDERGDAAPLPLDQETPTIAEPAELVIWVESKIFDDDPNLANRLVGAGLRGRWGLMGDRDGSLESYTQWWTFKAKDYILPSFWLDLAEPV